MRFNLRINSNLKSVRGVKSSQGIRRGTCGWITSYFTLPMLFFTFFKIFILTYITNTNTLGLKAPILQRKFAEIFINSDKTLFSNGLVAQTGRAHPLQGWGPGFKSRRVHL